MRDEKIREIEELKKKLPKQLTDEDKEAMKIWGVKYEKFICNFYKEKGYIVEHIGVKNNELTGGIAGWTVEKVDSQIVIKDLKFQATFMGYQWAPADRAAGRLTKRHDLVLDRLEASGPMIESFGTNLAERTNFVHQTLGSEVPITILP